MLTRRVGVLACLALAGCGDVRPPARDGGAVDAARQIVDAGLDDAGVAPRDDAGASADAGAPGMNDAGTRDGGVAHDGGACEEDAGVCDDGDPCTVDDTCTGGVCAGTAMVCASPPPSVCVGDTERRYVAAGTCEAGTCVHATTDTPCPLGCADGACVPACVPMPWALSYVGSAGDWGGSTAIVLDGAGGVHIAYHSATYGSYAARRLMHGYLAPGASTWANEHLVTGTGNDNANTTAIAIDPAGTIHIAYPGLPGATFAHAFRPAGGAWSTEDVGSGNTAASIAFDASGAIHLSHTTASSAAWATRSAGTWADTAIRGDWCAAIAIDSRDRLHVAYAEDTGTDTRLAHAVHDGTWSYEDLELLGYTLFGHGCDVAIGIDDADGTHIAINGSTEIRYAYQPDGGAWSVEGIGAGGRVFGMALDARAGVHFAVNGSYLHRPLGGSAWTVSSVDWRGTQDPAIAVDATGRVHISYYEGTTVRYATGRVCPE